MKSDTDSARRAVAGAADSNAPSKSLDSIEAQLEAVWEQSSDALMLCDLQGRILRVNRRHCEYLGYSPQELLGEHQKICVPKDSQRDSLERQNALVRGEKFDSYERRLVRKDGREILVENSAALIRDAAGDPLFLQCAWRDVTQTQLEMRTLQRIATLTAGKTGLRLLESVCEGLAVATQSRHTLICSCSDLEHGLSEPMIYLRDQEVCSCDSVTFPPEFLRQSFETELFLSSGAPGHFPHLEWIYELEVESLCVLPLHTQDGRKVGVLLLFDAEPRGYADWSPALLRIYSDRIATELARLKSEEAVADSESKMRELLSRIPAVVYRHPLDSSSGSRYVSPQIEKMFGFTQEEWCRSEQTWRNQIHPEDRERAVSELEASIESKDHFAAEYRFMTKGGEMLWIRDEGVIVRDASGRARMIQGIAHDRTTTRQLEEEIQHRRNLDSLGLLAGGIAHDFNNLLMSILGNLSLARADAPPGSPLAAQLENAEAASNRARALTQQLLTLSQGGSPIRDRILIEDLLRESVTVTLSRSPVRVDLDIAKSLHGVLADADQLSQVLNNLLTNAAQAMPCGGTISISAENLQVAPSNELKLNPGRYVRIRIADEGEGVSPAIRDRIFAPYFTTKPDGTGLGLATSYSIIKKHDGLLRLDGTSQRPGASFSLYLPAALRGGIASSALDGTDPGADRRPQPGGRILVMDDDDAVRETILMMLQRLGLETIPARHGEEAIEIYQDSLQAGTPFDCVILDLTVPGAMGGRAAIAKLREIDPDVRAVVSSGYSADPVLANFKSYGFGACLTKPFSMDALQETLSQYLRSKTNSRTE